MSGSWGVNGYATALFLSVVEVSSDRFIFFPVCVGARPAETVRARGLSNVH